MIGDYSQWDQQVTSTDSVAAAAEVVVGPPIGEIWRILYACASHDDPVANAGVYYLAQSGGAPVAFGDGIALATNIKAALYTQAKCGDCIVLFSGDTLRFTGSAVAAGKKWTMRVAHQVLRGVTN
jgi:hypothetical protein